MRISFLSRKEEDAMNLEQKMLLNYLQKAAGQLACARDQAAELIPTPVEMVTRLQSMVTEVERMKVEVTDYAQRRLEERTK